jgi:hypothetical protein
MVCDGSEFGLNQPWVQAETCLEQVAIKSIPLTISNCLVFMILLLIILQNHDGQNHLTGRAIVA